MARVSLNAGLAAALVLSLLAVSGMPAQAASTTMQSDTLVVGSQHTDFGTGDEPQPQTLSNLTRTGSGDNAVIELANAQQTESFESGGLTGYDGDTSPYSITSTYAADGGQSLEANPGGSEALIANTSLTAGAGTNFTYRDRLYNSDSHIGGLAFGLQNTGGYSTNEGYYVTASSQNDELEIWRLDGSGNNVQLAEVVTSGIPDSEFLDVRVYWEEDGTITVELYDSGGDFIDSATATDTTYSSGYVGWFAFEHHYFDDLSANSGTPANAQYESAIHDIDGAEEAAVNVTEISNVSVNATVRTDGGTVLNKTTISGTGNHTLLLSSTASSQLETVLDVEVTGENPSFELADESILFTNHAPEADNLSPPDGTELTQSSVDFSVDVSDEEFPTAQGDQVTAELFVDGSSVGSQTVSSNQTVTLTESLSEGGDHTYHWELTDDYGATTTTSTRTVTVPATLEIRDVTNTTKLVDGDNATVTFYGGEDEREIIERSADNGTISLDGVPTDTEFTIVVRADDYYTRQTIIPSIYEQSNIWMLPKNSTDAVEIVFLLEDRSGDFAGSDSTQLRVQRAVEYNNTTEWRDVVGDDISATAELATVLENKKRYRLVISNDVQTRILGSYSPSGPADPEVIPIGQIDFQGDSPSGTAFDASVVNETSPGVRLMYRDPDGVATSLKYRVTNITDSGNETVVIANTTVNDPSAFTSVTEALPANTTLDGSTYRVEVWAYENGNLVDERSASVGRVGGPGGDWHKGINSNVLTLGGYVFLVGAGYGTANYNPRLGVLVAVALGAAMTLLGVVAIPHVVLGFTGTIALIANASDRDSG